MYIFNQMADEMWWKTSHLIFHLTWFDMDERCLVRETLKIVSSVLRELSPFVIIICSIFFSVSLQSLKMNEKSFSSDQVENVDFTA